MGRRRYATSDTSRNSALIAFITMGEDWHNNHHYFQASCRQGFYWWEFDASYYVLKGLSYIGLVRDIKEPPARVKTAARVRDGQFDQGMFKAYWGQAGAALANVRAQHRSSAAFRQPTIAVTTGAKSKARRAIFAKIYTIPT